MYDIISLNLLPLRACRKMSLINKVVLVTGASSGIGAATAKLFTKEGAKVAIVGRNEVKLKNVTSECEKIGAKPLVISADISKDPDAERAVDTTVKQFGKIDVLVNNAGIGGMSSLQDKNAMQIFDKVMGTNIRAVVYLTHLAIPHLVASKGNIINISSMLGLRPTRNQSAYCTSKAALDHFSRCVALELASKGVRCNTVNPGPVQTDILENTGLTEKHQTIVWDNFKKATVLDRISEPNEIAEMIVFLASDKAKGITGSSFVTDNGASLK